MFIKVLILFIAIFQYMYRLFIIIELFYQKIYHLCQQVVITYQTVLILIGGLRIQH